MSNEQQTPGPVRDYHVPDPPPPLPSGSDPDVINPETKYILELYAQEIRDHASGILSIYGLSPTATSAYKRFCFEAATSLDAAAQILRQNNRVHRATIVKAVPQVVMVDPNHDEGAQGLGPRKSCSVSRLTNALISPALIAFAVASASFAAFPAARGFVRSLLGL